MFQQSRLQYRLAINLKSYNFTESVIRLTDKNNRYNLQVKSEIVNL